jgi:glycosyltransferase involved in cell wall biosynthesis
VTRASVAFGAQTAAGWALLGANAIRVPRPRTAPLVSVVIATYNWSTVLRHAIRSVLAQRYENFELIVVGDGCSDDTEETVGAFRDPRVRWIGLEENSGGQSIPNNVGIEAAHGEIIAYLGHDDLWLRDHLLHLVAALERGPWTACAVTLALGPPGSNIRIIAPLVPYSESTWVPPSAVAHRRELVNEIGPWVPYQDIVLPPDNEFLRRAFASGHGFARTGALTVLKFNSALRPNSYRLRLDDEQAAFSRRLDQPRRLVAREVASYGLARIRRAQPVGPEIEAEPDVIPPGWYVRQWRMTRGLAPDPPSVAARLVDQAKSDPPQQKS